MPTEPSVTIKFQVERTGQQSVAIRGLTFGKGRDALLAPFKRQHQLPELHPSVKVFDSVFRQMNIGGLRNVPTTLSPGEALHYVDLKNRCLQFDHEQLIADDQFYEIYRLEMDDFITSIYSGLASKKLAEMKKQASDLPKKEAVVSKCRRQERAVVKPIALASANDLERSLKVNKARTAAPGDGPQVTSSHRTTAKTSPSLSTRLLSTAPVHTAAQDPLLDLLESEQSGHVNVGDLELRLQKLRQPASEGEQQKPKLLNSTEIWSHRTAADQVAFDLIDLVSSDESDIEVEMNRSMAEQSVQFMDTQQGSLYFIDQHQNVNLNVSKLLTDQLSKSFEKLALDLDLQSWFDELLNDNPGASEESLFDLILDYLPDDRTKVFYFTFERQHGKNLKKFQIDFCAEFALVIQKSAFRKIVTDSQPLESKVRLLKTIFADLSAKSATKLLYFITDDELELHELQRLFRGQ